MNYTYVGRDLDSYDWVAATESNQARGIYMRAADLVERIVAQKKPGSIIPLQVGAGEGRRDDYLFQKLDILINELVRRGYDIVPVSTLIEHADGERRTDGEKGETAVNANDPVNAYKEIQIKTANQIRLIVMLYDGAIRHDQSRARRLRGGTQALRRDQQPRHRGPGHPLASSWRPWTSRRAACSRRTSSASTPS